MSKIKHVPNASSLIDEAIEKMPSQSKLILNKLRLLIHKADSEIIEDWKWGPNFYKDGKVCNIWGFKNHSAIVFFNGASMKDPLKLFNYGESNSHNRTIKFTDVKQINDKAIIAYVKESVAINKIGMKASLKEIKIPDEIRTLFVKYKLIKSFEKLSFTFKKEIILSITTAKQESTKQRRILKAIEFLKTKELNVKKKTKV